MSHDPLNLRTVADICVIELPAHPRVDGELVVAESGSQVPFAIARFFSVRATAGTERGRHAHRLCSQFMLCTHGAVDVICDDGAKRRSFTLDRANLALLTPPTIWNTVVFRQDHSVLSVLCDRPYEEEDYIRDYDEFLEFRRYARP